MQSVKTKLQFLLPDGSIHPLNYSSISIKRIIPILYRCHYKYAQIFLPTPREVLRGGVFESKHGRVEGFDKHKELQGILGITGGRECEVEVACSYKDIEFLGYLDYAQSLNAFEEWHFSQSSTPYLTPHELLYPDTLAYFYLKIHPLSEVTYYYRVWGKNTPVHYDNADIDIKKVYSEQDFPTTERELDKLVAYYTGKVPCIKTYGGCDFCRFQSNCLGGDDGSSS